MSVQDISPQAPRAVVMVRPHHFCINPATAADNAFQVVHSQRSVEQLAAMARDEVSAVAARLEAAGVIVHLYEDRVSGTPDSVFPNNWFSTHSGGHVAVFPMYSPSRRAERRWDIIEMLKAQYRVQHVIDYSGLEADGTYLEGTGAMVLDHIERIAYTSRSNRANEIALERFCTHFNFEPFVFDATDNQGRPIYHTNVLMCIGTQFCLIGLDSVSNMSRRAEIRDRLINSGRTVIDLTVEQLGEFAGNALELSGRNGALLAISSRALRSLSANQVAELERSVELLPVDVPTIEMAGGSVRCMLASIHLTPRSTLR
jgi:hypothetical protein